VKIAPQMNKYRKAGVIHMVSGDHCGMNA